VFQHPHSCGSFPFDPSFCGSDLESDIFVAKVTADGSIGFVTYDGVGSGNGIAVDSSGIYVTGEAIPPDGDIIVGFPFVNNAGDLFVQRMSLDGQSLYYTIAGGPGQGFGSGHDAGNGIALDDLHNAWAVGVTDRDGSAKVHVLLVKIAPDGSELVERAFSSDGNDVGFGVAVAARQPWLTGQTCGSGFPTTDGIVHHPNHCAVFVLHQDEAGNDLMGMIFGGDGADDGGIAIVTNGSNAAFVTGFTNNSFNFPRTTLGLDAAFVFSLPMGFVTEVSAVGASPGTIVRSATTAVVSA